MRTFQKLKKALVTVCSTLAIACLTVGAALALPTSNKVSAATNANTGIDFSKQSDLKNFATTEGTATGTIENGKYYPVAWARNYLNVALPTDQTRLVSFDFYAPSTAETGDTYSQAWISLITDVADINTAGKSLGVRLYSGAGNWLASAAQSTNGSYLSETAEQFTFGVEHRVDILIKAGKVSFAIDGVAMNFLNGYGTSLTAPTNGVDSNAYLYFEFSHAGGYIDNVTVTDGTSNDFSNNFVADKFIDETTTNNGVKTADGKWKPVGWGRYYYNVPIDTTEDVKITYDFYATSRGSSTYSQMYASLVSDLADINGANKSIAFRLYDDNDSISYSVFPSAQTTSGLSSLAWKTDKNFFDAEHKLEIKILNGKITYSVDGAALFGATFTVPADTVYLFWEFSKSTGYIDNLTIEPVPFEEISLDFSTSAQGTNNFATVSGSTNWGVSNGTWKSGGTYRISYLKTPIPVNEFKYIAFDFYEANVANTSGAANLRLGLTDALANRNTVGHNLGLHIWPDKMYLANKITATNAHIKNLTAITLGQVHRLEIIIDNEAATFLIDGKTWQSSYALPFADQDPSTKETAYLVLDDAVGKGAYIDNLVVLNKDSYQKLQQEKLDKQYGIEVTEKNFDGYDEKKTPNAIDSGIAWGKAYTALKDKATVRRSTYYNIRYDLSGAEYYAFDVSNNTDGYVAFGVDMKEGYYAKNGAIAAFGSGSITHGRWWTAAENMPYYLIYEDGTVKTGEMAAHTLNRGKAVIPSGFNGTVVFPISSFEILDWSANTASYDWFTDDSNVPALNHVLFTDVIYCAVTATEGSVTTSNERILGSDLGAAASVARTIRAIDQIGAVSAASERLIAFARENYDALSEADQANVTNYATLEQAEETFYSLPDYSYAVGTDGKNFEGTGGVAFGKTFESAPSTVSAWIRVARTVADDEHVGTVIGNAERKMSSSVLYDYWNTFSFEITTNGNPKFEWRVSRTKKAVFIVENADVRTGSWMHVAFTRDTENGLLTCYINGAAVASMAVDTADIANFAFVKPVKIGSDYTDDKILALSFSPDFHGYIAEARVYSTLLNEAAVQNDMLGERADGLLGGIDFASGEHTEYYDYANANGVDAFGWKAVDTSYFAAENGEYTFAVIPDTQMLFSRAPKDSNGVGIYQDGYNVADNAAAKNVQWLIDNKATLNLQYVMHVGDLTDNLNYYVTSNVDSSKKKWEVEGKIEANYGFQILDKLTTANIPWSISRGNHDGGYDSGALAIWDTYWQQSGAYAKATAGDEATGEPAKYCVTTRNSVDHIYSYYEKIDIGEQKYLVIVLDLEADSTVLAWANEVAAYFTDRKIIVSTHAYLGARGALMTSLMGTAGLNNSGETVWNEFVSKHANIELLICGHSSGEDIVRTQLTGENGNKVWNVMIDSSAHEFTGVTQPALMSLLKFSADGKTLTFNHYSMVQGELFGDFNTFSVTLGETATSGETAEAVWPNVILDADGNVAADFRNAAYNGVLPKLERAGRAFIGYAIDGKLYPAGTEYAATNEAPATAIFADFGMVNGAAIRFDEPTGLRFQTYLDKTAYAYLAESVTFGTLIAKADDITANGKLDYTLLTTDAAITKLNVASTAQHTVGDHLYFNGVLASIKAHHYDWKFAARAYMTVTYENGETATFYAGVTDNARSVKEIAQKALADISAVQSAYYKNAVEGGYSAYTQEQMDILNGFLSETAAE